LVPTTPVTLMNIGNSGPASSPATALADALAKAAPSLGAFGDITGRAQLEELQKATLQSAGDARQQAISSATDLAKAAMTSLPEIMKAKAGADKAAKKDEPKKLSAEEKDTALAKLKTSLPAFINMVGGAPTAAVAKDKASNIISSLFQGTTPALADLTEIAPLLTAAAGDDAVATAGKAAFLAALGL